MNVLFVCTGNISRSFLAETLLRNEVEQLKADNISVSSAGLFAYPGKPPDPKILDYLSKTGIPVRGHEARQITKQDVDWANLILVMEKEHANMIEKLWPEVKGKVELLGQLISGGQNPDDIVDPFGRSPYHYRLAQSQITLAVKSLATRLAAKQTNKGN